MSELGLGAAFFAELVGTFIFVLLGDGVVANVCLKKTNGTNSGWIVITTGYGLALAIGAFSVANVTGAHLNPAVTLGMYAIGNL